MGLNFVFAEEIMTIERFAEMNPGTRSLPRSQATKA